MAKKEGLAPSEDEINAEIDKMASLYKWSNKKKSEIDKDIIFRELSIRKAYDFVMDHALEIA